jgi:hypothetical protein
MQNEFWHVRLFFFTAPAGEANSAARDLPGNAG